MDGPAWTEVNAMPAAAPRPESPDDALDAALAALTATDIPPDEQDYAWAGAADGRSAELAGLSDADLAELLAEPPPRPAAAGWPLSYQTPQVPGGWPWPAGFAPRDGSGGGAGFADGGPLDTLDASITLAGFADDGYDRAGGLDDDSLVGVLRGWRRLTSWAQARELAMIAALARRRPADGTPPAAGPGEFPAVLSEFLGAEVAAALTLTAIAAGKQVGLALDLAQRPATQAALAAGRIDLPRARELTTMLGPLTAAYAGAVEAAVLPQAPAMTTGQLRAALAKAILALDPDAVRRRREEAEKQARVEHYPDPDGTATLAGRNLPPAQVLAASKRLTQIATRWKKLGALGGMDLLRAHAYLALLNGLDVAAPPASLLPAPAPGPAGPGPGPGYRDDGSGTAAGHPGTGSPGTGSRGPRHGSRGPHDGSADPGDGRRGPHDGNSGPDEGSFGPDDGPDGAARPDGAPVPAGLRKPQPGPDLPPLAGLISLTIPLTTLMQLGDAPGYGPVDAGIARLLACALAGHRATRWQITVTAPDGTALATGPHRGPAGNSQRSADSAGTGPGSAGPDTAGPGHGSRD